MTGTTRETELETLYRQATMGDTGAFWKLVKPFERSVFAVAFGLLKDTERAQDVLHDTYVRAFSTIGNLRNPSRIGTWLYSMGRNIAQEHIRRATRDEKLVTQPAAQPVVISVPDLLIQEEELQRLDQAIKSLPESHRVVLALRYTNNLSCKDIAETLDIGLEAAKSRLFEARKALHARLKVAETARSREKAGG